MNVMLTRAKRGLVIVGHMTTLEHCQIWRDWLSYMKNNNLILSNTASGEGEAINIHHHKLHQGQDQVHHRHFKGRGYRGQGRGWSRGRDKDRGGIKKN